MDSKKRVALVTGGASGIGFAFARRLAEGGYAVGIVDLKGSEAAASNLKDLGHMAVGIDGDVTVSADVAKAVGACVKDLGGLDVLVNNAALYTTLKMQPFDEISDEEWMRVMRVNTLGPFVCAKAALPALKASKAGRIINVASIVPMKGTPLLSHYTASKGAVISFTRVLARELGSHNITANAIAPGFTLSDGALENKLETLIGDVGRRTSRCIQRDQLPEDLVGALMFLAGDDAAFITGQTLVVDGGSAFV